MKVLRKKLSAFFSNIRYTFVRKKHSLFYYYNYLFMKLGGGRMYKTIVISYSPKADDMAQKIEEKANEMLENGYELVTMSITGTAKAILVFKK